MTSSILSSTNEIHVATTPSPANEDVFTNPILMNDGTTGVVYRSVGSSVFFRHYALDGTPQADQIELTSLAGAQSIEVTSLSSGGFAMAWSIYGASGGEVMVQLFDATGTATTSAVNVSGAGTVSSPNIIETSTGDLLVSWDRWDGTAGATYAPEMRFLTQEGALSGAAPFSPVTARNTVEPDSHVAELSDGTFVVARSFDSSALFFDRDEIHVQRFAADGTPIGAEFQANVSMNQYQSEPNVTALGNGNYVVTWSGSFGLDGSFDGVFGRVFAADGTPVTDEIQLNTTTNLGQYAQEVVALPDGGFMAVWLSDDHDDDQSGGAIVGRIFNDDGTAFTDEFIVPQSTGASQWLPSVAVNAAGDLSITWQSHHLGGNQWQIMTRLYEMSAPPPSPTEGNDTLTGTAAAESINALGGDDLIINAGGGEDTFDGGAGNDTLSTDVSGLTPEFVLEFNATTGVHGRQGSSVGRDVIAGIENFTMQGSWNAHLTGDALDNMLTTDQGDDTLIGLAGNDTLMGGDGNDSLVGGDGNDEIHDGSGNDEVFGGAGDDTFYMGLGGGEDTFNGGAGSDMVIVDLSSQTPQQFTVELDLITGDGGGVGLPNGRDTFVDVESYRLIGDFDATLMGDTANNHFQTDAGIDTLNGWSGDDTLDGGAGGDLMIGGHGSDTFYVDDAGDRVAESRKWAGHDTVISSVDFRMGRRHIEDLELTGTATLGAGNGLMNRITGNDGNNTLDGGKNVDTLVGGLGNDLYIVRSPGDNIVEGYNEGIDAVRAYRSYALDGHVEKLYMQNVFTAGGAPANLNGIGNGLANTIIGTPYDNTIVGREGNDILKGQAGDDTFVFDRAIGAGNVDRIIDFEVIAGDNDTLKIKGALLGGAVATGVLDAADFAAGTVAGDASDRFVFDQASGQLWFDADGSGAGGQVLMATFEQNATVAADDILIF